MYEIDTLCHEKVFSKREYLILGIHSLKRRRFKEWIPNNLESLNRRAAERAEQT